MYSRLRDKVVQGVGEPFLALCFFLSLAQHRESLATDHPDACLAKWGAGSSFLGECHDHAMVNFFPPRPHSPMGTHHNPRQQQPATTGDLTAQMSQKRCTQTLLSASVVLVPSSVVS